LKAQDGFEKYGLNWSGDDHLAAELYCYLNNRAVKDGGLGRAVHFQNCVEMIWGKHNKKKRCIIHPWWQIMNEAACADEVLDSGELRQQRYLGISGCGLSGKSDYGAVYALVNWMADPVNTLVLCTSTDLKASKLRIWGRIMSYFDAIPTGKAPGVLVASQGVIVTTADNGKRLSDESGISLIAGDKKREREAIGKIIGAHNKRVIFLADELPELSEALLEAAYSNLATNPFFQMFGFGNFKSRYDPFGQFIQPKRGWDSLTIEDDEWETERGFCIRLDGLKSPNLIEDKDIWPIYGRKQLAGHRKDLGENSAGFYRMCRSFESPIGLDNAIYSEADLLAGSAYEKVKWLTKPIRVSSLDPSFTNGGDRAVQWFGSCGIAVGGVKTLCYDRFVLLREDVRKKLETRDFQIARQFRDNCITEGVSPKHAALDCTGAGSPFLSIVREEWSPEVLGVDFSGAPSEMTVSVDNSRTAKQAYDRKVSEIWYVGKEFLKYGQLKGIIPELAREMKARRYDTAKGVEGLKVKVETKQDIKERLLFSPDMADAAFVMLHLCRSRLGLVPGSGDRGISGARSKFFELALQTDRVYHTLYAAPD
jgi:hypothetical protein